MIEPASQERARHAEALFEGMDDAVFVHDLDGRILDVNPAACRRLGYSRDELLRMSTRDIDDQSFATGFDERLQEQLSKGRLSCEGCHITKDGRRIPVDINTSIVEIDGKQAVIAVMRDISRHKRIEEALRDSEALYQSLVESLPQNIFRKDLAGRVTFGNQRYCATLGLPLDQLLGKTDHDLFPPELAEKYRRDDQAVLESGRPLEAVEGHRLPSGEMIYVQVVKTPVRDAQGSLIGTQAIFWDVTARKRSEEEIHRINAFLDSIIENIPTMLFVKEAGELRFERVNKAGEELLGVRREELIGKNDYDIFPEAEADFFTRKDREVLAGKKLVDVPEEEIMTRHGKKILHTRKIPILDDRGEPKYLLGISEDITELIRIRAMLVQSEKLASIGLLSAGLAHEINNPLAYVANNLVVLERDMKGVREVLALYEQARPRLADIDPQTVRNIEEVAERIDLEYIRDNLDRILTKTREGVERMAKIVQGLRSLARTDRPQLEEVYLPDLVESSLEMVRGRMQRRGIKVHVDFGDVPRIRCVSTQIGQVVLNLLVNAQQAIESTFMSSSLPWGDEHGVIRVSIQRAGNELCLEVADDGCGIDPKDLSRIFDPFYTSKPVGEGTGLGLSISHNIVTGHGGRMDVDSTPGAGSRFRVFLPLEQRGPA